MKDLFIYYFVKPIRESSYFRFYNLLVFIVANFFKNFLKNLYSLFFAIGNFIARYYRVTYRFLVNRVNLFNKSFDNNNFFGYKKFQKGLLSSISKFSEKDTLGEFDTMTVFDDNRPSSLVNVQNQAYPIWAIDPEFNKEVREILISSGYSDVPMSLVSREALRLAPLLATFSEPESEEEVEIENQVETIKTDENAILTADNMSVGKGFEPVPIEGEGEGEADPLSSYYIPYVPISLLHFYGLTDDFFSSDIFNNFVIDEFLYRFIIAEREEEFSKILHQIRDFPTSVSRDNTLGLQTRPKFFKRNKKVHYSVDIFNNSISTRYLLPLIVMKSRSNYQFSPESVVRIRRTEKWTLEWIRTFPPIRVLSELNDVYNESIASNLFPILAFIRNDYQDFNVFRFFLYSKKKFRRFSFFFSEGFLSFNYNLNSKLALVFLRIVRVYENFLFMVFYFIDNLKDNFYNDIYLYYLKRYFMFVPGFKRFFYTSINLDIEFPISKWMKERALIKRKTYRHSIRKILNYVLMWGPIKEKPHGNVRKRDEALWSKVVMKFNDFAINNDQLREFLHGFSNLAKVSYLEFYQLLNKLEARDILDMIVPRIIDRIYYNLIIRNSGLDSDLKKDSNDSGDQNLILNKDFVDMRTAYFYFLRLQQSQNQSFKELRSIFNFPVTSEVKSFRSYLPIYKFWKPLLPPERNMKSEKYDLDLETLDYNQMTGFYPGGGFDIDSLDFSMNIVPALIRMEMYQNISDLTDIFTLTDPFTFDYDSNPDEPILLVSEKSLFENTDLDLVSTNTRGGENIAASENIDMLEEMRDISADDRYEYISSESGQSLEHVLQNIAKSEEKKNNYRLIKIFLSVYMKIFHFQNLVLKVLEKILMLKLI